MGQPAVEPHNTFPLYGEGAVLHESREWRSLPAELIPVDEQEEDIFFFFYYLLGLKATLHFKFYWYIEKNYYKRYIGRELTEMLASFALGTLQWTAESAWVAVKDKKERHKTHLITGAALRYRKGRYKKRTAQKYITMIPELTSAPHLNLYQMKKNYGGKKTHSTSRRLPGAFGKV
jgi:hypothetical protein